MKTKRATSYPFPLHLYGQQQVSGQFKQLSGIALRTKVYRNFKGAVNKNSHRSGSIGMFSFGI